MQEIKETIAKDAEVINAFVDSVKVCVQKSSEEEQKEKREEEKRLSKLAQLEKNYSNNYLNHSDDKDKEIDEE